MQLPKVLAKYSIEQFAALYKINVAEAEKPLSEYHSIGDFFVRKLRDGARPLGQANLVNPADARITQAAAIKEEQLIQAKGKTYGLSDFLVDPKAAVRFKDGFFMTYYLCPTDYHRVHSPVSGQIIEAVHVPGKLWPVNDVSVESVDRLFSLNERVILRMQTEFGQLDLVFVGATNVGKISLSFDDRIVSNDLKNLKNRNFQYQPPVRIEKGQELGQFNMGSTVILVFSAGFAQQLKNLSGLIGKQSFVGANLN